MSDKNIAAAEENLPAYMQGGNKGQGDVSAEDLVIPRLEIIQAISPQLSKNKPEFVEGAVAGEFYNTANNMLYGETIKFVPVYFQKEFIIWKDRKAGGGYRGSFPTEAEAREEMESLEDGAQCDIAETHNHFGFMINDNGDAEEIVISASRSKLRFSRQFNSMIRMAGGDRFSREYEISVVEASNDLGSWYSQNVKQLGYVSEEVYKAADEFYDSMHSNDSTKAPDYSDKVNEEKSNTESDEF